jgi:O-methyltransferase domain
MLAITGGRERTEKEYRELLSAAGFELDELIQTSGSFSILGAKARDMPPLPGPEARKGRSCTT